MSSSYSSSDSSAAARGMMFWLPPGGFGNGLPATAWAQIADVAEEDLAEVVLALTDAGIPAYVAAPLPGARHRTRLRSRTRYRLWVDPMHYGQAEDVLMALFRRFDRRETDPGERY
jgi:hypothetical protein